MKIKNGKIIEITETELFNYWLCHFDEIYTFDEYKLSMINHNVKIIKEK